EAISRFLFASQPDAAFDAEFEALGVDLVLAGHAGLPFARTSGERLWLNAGVIGMPANDGDPRGWFLTLDDAGGHAFHRLDYDWRSAALDMRFNGLPEPYARALETGLWPSLDVLPAAERAATGLSPDLSQGASPAI
ncbi:MAG: metallophosphoesterase family protein, partial [Rhodospirillales bacterium]